MMRPVSKTFAFLMPRVSNVSVPLSRSTHLISRRTVIRNLPRRTLAAKADSQTISQITQKEKELTGSDQLVKEGPTAQAQKHVGQTLTGDVISDITKGEKKVTGGERVKGGPTSTAQSIAMKSMNTSNTANSAPSSGVLDSNTISKITAAERELTGKASPVKGGPTAQAQKHAREPITSEALHDITEGEKKIAGERVGGGPTSIAQSELGKSRQ